MFQDSMSVPRPLVVGDWLSWPDLSRVVASIASRYRVNPADIPDLIQEVKLTLWKAGANRPVNATWIFSVVGSRTLDHLRREERNRLSPAAGTIGDVPESSNGDAELAHLLRARVSSLPSDLRRYCRLRYEEGMSEREVAGEMHVSRSSVRRLGQRCRRKLSSFPAA